MATAPFKSQPLHNFSFSFLKWGTATTIDTHHHHSPCDNSEPESDNNNNIPLEPDPSLSRPPIRVGSRSSRPHRSSFSTLLLSKPQDKNDDEEEEEAQEEVSKPWNLRPRRASGDAVVALPVVGYKESKQQQQRENLLETKPTRLRGLVDGGEKKEKNKFWIALSKDEIEEDIFIMTGSRPSRRPRKRSKIVQTQLTRVRLFFLVYGWSVLLLILTVLMILLSRDKYAFTCLVSSFYKEVGMFTAELGF
ncbi:DUF1639 domain-containing protein [Cephalotus follicularis]|uniref:DUF1639 domain-containing protein n=1 Tax=Cephalotus follicularis TaxID=3775 RepID=A0A1Q3CD28_CEPFO|nr:DUF1639 domain-containing protein [Cephalotus follicularis]